MKHVWCSEPWVQYCSYRRRSLSNGMAEWAYDPALDGPDALCERFQKRYRRPLRLMDALIAAQAHVQAARRDYVFGRPVRRS